MSTESGIPDYRSAGVGLYARSNRRPIQVKKQEQTLFKDLRGKKLDYILKDSLNRYRTKEKSS